MSGMRIGLVLPVATSDAARVLAFATRAEELGFDGVFAFDHLFPPGAPSDRPSLEAYATLAAVASVTERVRVGTLVTRASLRPAGMLAKQATMVADIAGGRFVLAIGTGDAISKAEHDAFGLPYLGPAIRRDHLVETVRAVRALFRGEAWGGGVHVPRLEGPLAPPPRGGVGPPVWIGGVAEATVRAAAREADGWNAWGIDLQAFSRLVEVLRGEAGSRPVEATWGGVVVVGRDEDEARSLAERRRARRAEAEAFAGGPEALVGWLRDWEEAGAAWMILLAAGGMAPMELIGERVLPSVRATSPR